MPSALNIFAHRSWIIATLLFTTTLLTLEHPGSHSLIQPISEHLGKHTTIYWRTLAPRTGDTRALTTGGEYTGINLLTSLNLCNGNSSSGLSTDTFVFTANIFVTQTHRTLDESTDMPEYPLNDCRHSWYTNPDERNFYFHKSIYNRTKKRKFRKSKFAFKRQSQKWETISLLFATLLFMPYKLVSHLFSFLHFHSLYLVNFSLNEDIPSNTEIHEPTPRSESPLMII